MAFTRADYMAGRCTHCEFYGEIVKDAGIRYREDDPLTSPGSLGMTCGEEG